MQNIDIEDLNVNEILLDSIHYQELQYDSSRFICKTTRDYICAIYLSNTKVQTIQEFRNKAQSMFDEMKKLQIILRKIMNVDKTYNY